MYYHALPQTLIVWQSHFTLTSRRLFLRLRLKSEPAIAAWIASEMKMRSCIVVLIGKETASRKWVKYEIEKAWKDGKGIVGIYIHGLENSSREQSQKGSNPFDRFYVDKTINYIAERTTPADQNDVKLSSVCKAYDPPYITSKCVYDYIKVQFTRDYTG